MPRSYPDRPFVGVGVVVAGFFSHFVVTIFGGLILLVLALNMVIGGGKSSGSGHGDIDPMSMAVSPLAIPLMLNPVGIVILVIASVEVQDLWLR